MNTLFTRILAIAFGVALLVPAFAMAQIEDTNTGTVPPRGDAASVRAEMKAQFIASSTQAKEEMRLKADLRANAAMRLATTTQNTADRILHAKERAGAEIERRIVGLEKLLERITEMKRVSASFKGDLRAAVDEQISQIEILRQRIEAGTSTSTLKEDIQSITRSYRIFALVMPQAQIAAAADRIVTITATLTEIGAKLDVRIEAAEAEGEDVSALVTALQSLATHIDSANAHAQTAVEGTATLDPDNGDTAVAEANRAALQAAREELRLAHEEITAAREDVATIVSGLRSMNQTADATTTTSTEVE